MPLGYVDGEQFLKRQVFQLNSTFKWIQICEEVMCLSKMQEFELKNQQRVDQRVLIIENEKLKLEKLMKISKI